MKWTGLAVAALMCLAFLVHSRSIPSRAVPPLSIAAVESSSTRSEQSLGSAVASSSAAVSIAEDFCMGEIPDQTKELVTVLQYLHNNTIQAFESSPRFGGNRGGFGGGQFGDTRGSGGFGGSNGQPQEVAKPVRPPRPAPNHSAIPEPDPVERRRFYGRPTSMKGYDPQWTWLSEMRGITGRGFVYKSNDRHVVGMPVAPTVDEFLDQVVASEPSTDLGKDERVWDIVELQLIGLFMHPEPVAYNKHLMINESDESPKTRVLDEFERESLKNLRAGAERVMAWDAEENCLRVLGAIRTKEGCLKCHDVKTGLLGAFSYRIKEVEVKEPPRPTLFGLPNTIFKPAAPN